MRIVRIRIRNFRCIGDAEVFPVKHNVLLGPNNVGKTAVLEAINLVLNPELVWRPGVIDENDFFNRVYLPVAEGTTDDETEPAQPGPSGDVADTTAEQDGEAVVEEELQAKPMPCEAPVIRVELVLSGLSPEDENVFRDVLVPWKQDERRVVESLDEGTDPYNEAETAIRPVFEGWYDPAEDDFACKTFLLREEHMHRDDCPPLNREHKRRIGFLIYRDFRALTRPVTLQPPQLFSRLMYGQDVKPKHFEEALAVLRTALRPMTHDEEFMGLLNSYKAELERFLALSESQPTDLGFQETDGTRRSIRSEAQMYLTDVIELPLQKSGAGTRSLSILAMLTLIMRRRGRGILALEEPETFLFPHAQRRVTDECLSLASQTFITTHSPYVLERIPVEGVGRIERGPSGDVGWSPISTDRVKAVNLYSRRLRQACCEALLGRGVVVVEGDSDKWWVLGASRIMNRKEWNGRRQEALELLGVSVVGADTNGDILRLGAFFEEAGLEVAGLFDRVPEGDSIWDHAHDATFPCLFLKEAGLERLLADRLPEDVLRRMLHSAEYSRTELRDQAEVDVINEKTTRENAFQMLRANKGSAAMHEWLISLLDENTMPDVLKDLVDMLSMHMTGEAKIGLCSLSR
ncbi:MAG TPA: AAA family ATPase [Phycisphaerae bacterium]|nr:AAA family ATPase [Phycisphaerae bacterium]